MAAIPAEMIRPCEDLQVIPAGDQPPTVLMPLWMLDRKHLRTCGTRHAALAGAVVERDQVQGRAK